MTKILVVEDNDMNLELVQDILRGNGFESVSAMSGRQAIEVIKSVEVDLILMDLQMPEMDGHQTLAAIREQLAGKTPPTIAVTGNAMEIDRVRCLQDGFCDFVRKPFRIDDLLTTIENNLTSNQTYPSLKTKKAHYF